MSLRSKDYEILCKIGQGSFGQVFKVRRKFDKAILVMKLIKMQSLSNKNQQDSLHEVTILSSLNCPYIVKYYDSFVENTTLHIIMEYCEKGDLYQILKKQQLSHQKIWKFFIQICIGLEYLHSRQILHRDIKCLNIFLSSDDSIRIGDLGVAKILNNTAAFAQTQVGSPYYLSPELCEEKPYNTKSDVWALGCVVYEMCTGKHPFQAPTQGALLLKIINGMYLPLPSEIPAGLREIIDICLEKDYKKRPSIKALLQLNELQKAANGISLIIPTASVLHKIQSTENNPNVVEEKKETKEKPLKAIKIVEDVQKQIADARANKEKKITRPQSAYRAENGAGKTYDYFFNEMQQKIKEKSPNKICVNKPVSGLMKNNLKKDISDVGAGLLERRSEKDFPYMQKKNIAARLQKEQIGLENIKKAFPLKKIATSGKEEGEKPESRRENPETKPTFRINFRGNYEEPKLIYKPKVPNSAKAPRVDLSYDDIRLVQNLPDFPRTSKKPTIKCLQFATNSKVFKPIKKPLLEPFSKFSQSNRLEKSPQKPNTSIEEIILDTRETEHSQLKQKEFESLQTREKLEKKCSEMRRDIIKMLGNSVFNEMHKIFTSIITVKHI